MSTYPFKCDLCGGVTDAPTYGDFKCQHCGQAYVYDECHRIELSKPQLEALRKMPVIGRLGDQVMKDIVQAFAGAPKWILVSERLPEEGLEVMAWNNGGQCEKPWQGCVLCVYRNGEWRESQEFDLYPGVTHWMPLPEPPEVK